MTYSVNKTKVALVAVGIFTLAARFSVAAEHLPVTLKQFVMMDTPKMESMVTKGVQDHIQDDEAYFDNLAEVLAFKILPHPRLTERSAALNRLALRLEESDQWLMIYERATDKLMDAAKNGESAAEKATALAALTNLVTEVRSKSGEGYKDILVKIKDAKIEVPREAIDYARESIRYLPSPSEEAELSLKSRI